MEPTKMFHKLVHLDLKGGVPKMSFLLELLPWLQSLGTTGLLVEYEDMFPYSNQIACLSRSDAYSLDEINKLNECASANNMILIPLIQTFGHLEFVLKHEQFRHLRELSINPGSICPSCMDSSSLLQNIIDQLLAAHPNSQWLHIGADEVYSLNQCDLCKKRGVSNEKIFLTHVSEIAKYVKVTHKRQPIIWDDMMRSISAALIHEHLPGDLVEPMIWHYNRQFLLEKSYFINLTQVFPRVWAAGAFKGATGPCQLVTTSGHHVDNLESWRALIKCAELRDNFVGLVMTGWSRYDHFSVMCELLPAGLPTLALSLKILQQDSFTVESHGECSKELGFPELIPWEPLLSDLSPSVQLNFPGWRIYQGVHGLQLLHHEFSSLLNSDCVTGWVSKWHRTNLVGSPLMAARVKTQLNSLLERYKTWCNIFKPDMHNIFTKSCLDEWFDTTVHVKTHKLEQMVSSASKLVALGDSSITTESPNAMETSGL